VNAGVDMSFRIGQRVRHQDYDGKRVTGVVRGLTVDGERGLMVTIALDAPIVIPEGNGCREIHIHNQHAPAHEFSAFEGRDEIASDLLFALREALQSLEYVYYAYPNICGRGKAGEDMHRARVAIAKANGKNVEVA
jgi:hypothetical protein